MKINQPNCAHLPGSKVLASYLPYNGILPSRNHWITVITKKLATKNAVTNEVKHKNLEAQQAYN